MQKEDGPFGPSFFNLDDSSVAYASSSPLAKGLALISFLGPTR